MSETQKLQSEIAALIKLIQFHRNHPTISTTRLEQLKAALEEALKLLQV